jgi:protein SCO1/2
MSPANPRTQRASLINTAALARHECPTLINTVALARCKQPPKPKKLFQQFLVSKSVILPNVSVVQSLLRTLSAFFASLRFNRKRRTSTISNTHSALRTPHSPFPTPHSAPRIPHSALLLICLLTLSTSAANSTLSDQDLTKITFDQNLNQQISLSLPFRDEHGAPIQLSSCFDQKPVILLLGYYGCPLLCTLTLNGLIESLQDLRLDAGKDFTVINVSIDPNETTTLAAAKKRTYLHRYGHGQNERGWRFLTGDATATHQLADEIGFHYAYDPAIRQYAHPSGFVVLSPGGKVTQYFFGVKYSARELAQALHEAADGKTGSPIEKFLLLCFHYNPITGKYGNLVMTIVRASGVAILLALAWLLTHRKRTQNAPVPEGAPISASGFTSARCASPNATHPDCPNAMKSACDSPSPSRERAGVRGNATCSFSAFFASLRCKILPQTSPPPDSRVKASAKNPQSANPKLPTATKSAYDSPSPGGEGRGEGEPLPKTDSILPQIPHSALRTPHFR